MQLSFGKNLIKQYNTYKHDILNTTPKIVFSSSGVGDSGYIFLMTDKQSEIYYYIKNNTTIIEYIIPKQINVKKTYYVCVYACDKTGGLPKLLDYIEFCIAPTQTGGNTKSKNRIVVIKNVLNQDSVNYFDPMLGENKTHKTYKNLYVKTDQIRQIAKHAKKQDYSKLVALLSKFYKGRSGDIYKFMHNNDDDIFKTLKKSYTETKIEDTTHFRDKKVSETISRYIYENTKKDKFNKYLDIGCSSGNTTHYMGEYLDIQDIYGIDVIDTKYVNKNIKYINVSDQEKTRIPYSNNYFDLITCNMVLHHIKDIDEYIEEIYRVLKPKGILYIKEHDCWDSIDVMLVDLEHRLYTYLEDEPTTGHGYNIHQYMNIYGLDSYFDKFKFVAGDYVFNNLKQDISHTRAFSRIYTKK